MQFLSNRTRTSPLGDTAVAESHDFVTEMTSTAPREKLLSSSSESRRTLDES